MHIFKITKRFHYTQFQNPRPPGALRCPPALQAAAPAAAARRIPAFGAAHSMRSDWRRCRPHGPLLRPADLGVNDFLARHRPLRGCQPRASSRPGRGRQAGPQRGAVGRHRGKGHPPMRRGLPDLPAALAVPRLRALAPQPPPARWPARRCCCPASHVFHAVCIATFEELVCDAPARLCPRLPRPPAIRSGLSIPASLLPGLVWD
uniref:Vegetative cell wall protein gp1-like n=1 Tax=Macrostomum lignano TaxID=282301 RepID=A0A1I8FID5_9PLAT